MNETENDNKTRFSAFCNMIWATKAKILSTPRYWFTKKSSVQEEPTENNVIVQSVNCDTKSEEGCWSELKEFCKAHAIECSAFALFLLFGFFCILNAFGFLGQNDLKLRYSHYEQLVTEHCQFVENRNLHGSEGYADHPNATLVSLLVVVSHGDRFGLIANEKCQVLSEIENKEFNEYLSIATNQNMETLLKIPANVDRLRMFPSKEDCETSSLSPRGAIQEFAMGRFLYSQYKNTDLFSTASGSIRLTITSSNLQRTYASGIALVSGLSDQNKTKFSTPIEFKNGSLYYGCTDLGCNCDSNMKTLLQAVKAERQGLFRWESEEMLQHVQQISQKLMAEVEDSSASLDPFDVIEYLVAGYACRRKPLPCSEDYCADYSFFGDIFEYFAKQSEKLFDRNIGFERHYRVLSAFPILRYVILMAKNEEKQVQLFSSHNTIIGSILRILTDSGTYLDWQMLASRIAFEIYQTPEKTKYLRVLHDGNDITSSLKFCKKLDFGLCAISDLQRFLSKEIFEMAGFTSFEEVCERIHQTNFGFI